LLLGEESWIQDVRADDPAGFAQGFLLDQFLVDAHRCYDLPLHGDRRRSDLSSPLLLLNEERGGQLLPRAFCLQDVE